MIDKESQIIKNLLKEHLSICLHKSYNCDDPVMEVVITFDGDVICKAEEFL